MFLDLKVGDDATGIKIQSSSFFIIQSIFLLFFFTSLPRVPVWRGLKQNLGGDNNDSAGRWSTDIYFQLKSERLSEWNLFQPRGFKM